MLEREVLGDHAAHRDAVDVRRLDARGVHHRDDVGDHVLHRQQPARSRGQPGAAVVEQHHVGPLEVRHEAVPVAVRAAQPGDEHDRLTGLVSGPEPVDLDVAVMGGRHRGSL